MQKPEKIKYWSLSSATVLQIFHSTPNGLTIEEAELRLKKYGGNSIRKQNKTSQLIQFMNQFKSPIIIILIIATGISGMTGDWVDCIIISLIILASTVLSFFQEYSASNAVEELRTKVQVKSDVLRDGKTLRFLRKSWLQVI